MPVKQVVIVRTRYPDGKGGFFKPRTGKLIAQGAHASMKVLLDRGEMCYAWRSGNGLDIEWEDDPNNPGEPVFLIRGITPTMRAWLEGIFTKIAVASPDEASLVAAYEAATAAGHPCALIEDCGATEFHGVQTKTAVAIGPAESLDIDPITGGMTLL